MAGSAATVAVALSMMARATSHSIVWSSNMLENKALTTVQGSARSLRPNSPRPIALSTARSNTAKVSRRTSC
jgi:hypothetical protein